MEMDCVLRERFAETLDENARLQTIIKNMVDALTDSMYADSDKIGEALHSWSVIWSETKRGYIPASRERITDKEIKDARAENAQLKETMNQMVDALTKVRHPFSDRINLALDVARGLRGRLLSEIL